MWFPVVQLEPWFQMRFSCANWLSYDLVTASRPQAQPPLVESRSLPDRTDHRRGGGMRIAFGLQEAYSFLAIG